MDDLEFEELYSFQRKPDAADIVERLRLHAGHAQSLEAAHIERAMREAADEIERLIVAKAQQTAQADLRSAENVKLRHVLKGIAEFCSGDDTTLGAIARLAHIRNTVDQAMRRDEQRGDSDGR